MNISNNAKRCPEKNGGGGEREKKNKKTKQKEDMYNTPFTWKVERPKKKQCDST